MVLSTLPELSVLRVPRQREKHMTNAGPTFSGPPTAEEIARNLRAWREITDASHQFLIAGFKLTCDTEEKVRDAYRQWYEHKMKEHDRTIEQMILRLNSSGRTR
jgi:hypothetical protein